MCVIFIVSVGVLFVWFNIDGLLIFFVVCRICFGEIIKFQELMVVVVCVVMFFNCVIISGVFLLFILCRFGMVMFRFVGGVFIVKQRFGLMIEVVISVIIVIKDFISIVLQLIKCVLVLQVSSFGVVLEEMSVWKLEMVLQVMVMNRNGNRVFFYSGLVLLIYCVNVGIFSFGLRIIIFSVRLMIMLIFRKVVRQLCGVRISYIGSSVEIKVQLISVKVMVVFLKVSVGFQ